MIRLLTSHATCAVFSQESQCVLSFGSTLIVWLYFRYGWGPSPRYYQSEEPVLQVAIRRVAGRSKVFPRYRASIHDVC